MVIGLTTADERRDDARRLLEWGFRSFSEAKLFDAGEVVGHARVWGGQRMYVPLAGKGDVNVWLPRNPANQKLRAHIVYQWPLKPPLKKGDQVAMLRVTTSSDAMNEVPLYVAEDVGAGRASMRRGLELDPVPWLPAGCRNGSCARHGAAPSARAGSLVERSGRAAPWPSGKFITFEGGEGSGKSTQARLLADRLSGAGHRRGADARARRLAVCRAGARPCILDPATPPHSALSEALLFYAARADHLDKTIRPALAAGRWVICDRFSDSTRVYQGVAGGLGAGRCSMRWRAWWWRRRVPISP